MGRDSWGLAVYDGVRWTAQTTEDGLPDDDFSVLAPGRDGGLWAVSTTGGRVAYRGFDGEWHSLPPAPGAYLPTALAELPCGVDLCVALAAREGFYLWSEGRWKGPPDGLAATPIFGLAKLGNQLLAATSEGLTELDGDRLAPIHPKGLPAGGVYGLVRERDTVWLAGEKDQQGWVASLQVSSGPSSVKLVADGLALPPRSHGTSWALAGDGSGGILLGSRFGLLHVHPEAGSTSFGTATGLVADGASALLHDAEDLLWVATPRGLSRISSLRFASYDRAHGLFEDEVSAALELRQSGALLGHNRGLTLLRKGNPPRVLPFVEPTDALPGDLRVLDLEEDPGGGLWIAGSTLGLGYLAPSYFAPRRLGVAQTAAIRWQRPPAEPSITSVRVDHRGIVWASGHRGLYQLHDAQLALVPDSPRSSIRRLILGASGRLYAASDAGLFIGPHRRPEAIVKQ